MLHSSPLLLGDLGPWSSPNPGVSRGEGKGLWASGGDQRRLFRVPLPPSICLYISGELPWGAKAQGCIGSGRPS